MSAEHGSVVLAIITGRLSFTHISDFTTIDLIFACLFTYFAWVCYDVYLGPLSKFPGPKLWAASTIPRAWALWNGNETKSVHRLHEKYGPVVRIAPHHLSYIDAAAWKDIYSQRPGGEAKTFVKDPLFYVFDHRDPESITTADDTNHPRHRKILANSFSNKALREQEPLLKYWASVLISKLKEKEAAGKPADMVAYYNFTTFDIMGDLTFAEPFSMLEGSEYAPWAKIVLDSIKIVGKINAIKQLPFTARLIRLLMPDFVRQKAMEHFNYSADRVNRRLARDPGRPDLWTEVIKHSGNALDNSSAKMSLPEMHSNARLFMIAGTETTATLLSGLTYLLLKSPEKMAILVAEIRNAFSVEEDITVDALAKLPYLNACIEEGLRMYPPLPSGMPRLTPSTGAAVAGHWIPPNTTLSIDHWSCYHSPLNFSSPMLFAPERWLNDPNFVSDNKSAMQPFSIGPRNCLGRNLAYHEMRLLLCMVLWRFDLELLETEDWIDQKIFMLWDKKPLMIKFKSVR